MSSPSHARRLSLLLSCAFIATAAAAGPADIRFVDPARFSDAGFGSVEQERTQQILSDHVAALARRLPQGQTLHLEVLDIDLAGEMRPLRLDTVRVLGIGAETPRLHLRYELRQGDQVVLSGEDRLSDPGYLTRTGRSHDNRALHFERHMLDDWFQNRFAAQVAGLR
jgi:hypothetical protein